MKTEEEIEPLAQEYIKDGGDYYVYCGYIDGYTQCQEDMNDVIKQAIEYGYQLRCNNKPINSGIDWVKEFNSLNNI